MKPKKNIDTKELEAQKQALEEMKRKEWLLKQEEEKKKYEIIRTQTELDLIFTEWCLQFIWNQVLPRDFMMNFIIQYLKKKKIYQNFESLDIQTIADFNIYNIIFAKEDLKLDIHRQCILVNMLWQILINNNPKFQIEEEKNHLMSLEMSQNIINTQKSVEQSRHDKTAQSDFQKFRELVIRHSIDESPNKVKYFNEQEIKEIIKYFRQTYFDHYSLFQKVFNSQQQNEEIKISVFIDRPLEVFPLKDALFMGKRKLEVRDDGEENKEEQNHIEMQEHNKVELQKLETQQQIEQPQEKQQKQADSQLMQILDNELTKTVEHNLGNLRDIDEYFEKKK